MKIKLSVQKPNGDGDCSTKRNRKGMKTVAKKCT